MFPNSQSLLFRLWNAEVDWFLLTIGFFLDFYQRGRINHKQRGVLFIYSFWHVDKICLWIQDYATGQLENRAEQRARELRTLLGQLGPSFVKVGQALSARPDLLPQVYLEVISVEPQSLNPGLHCRYDFIFWSNLSAFMMDHILTELDLSLILCLHWSWLHGVFQLCVLQISSWTILTYLQHRCVHSFWEEEQSDFWNLT